jgi:multiple antibiotic resistance protein
LKHEKLLARIVAGPPAAAIEIALVGGQLGGCVMVYISYRYADAGERFLGSSGTSIVMRLLSFIMLCIGVQIMANGIRSYLAVTPR